MENPMFLPQTIVTAIPLHGFSVFNGKALDAIIPLLRPVFNRLVGQYFVREIHPLIFVW
jgi:hypothetical protein